MESAQQRLKEILAEAIARTDPAERAAYLGEACGEDLALRSKVEALVRAYEQHGADLEQPLGISSPVSEGPGTIIGRYKLLEQIGEGGFGVVFMAEQTEPIRRRVALKIIKPGMDTKQVIARFEAERQALALMDHPNIAKIFDAGATGVLPSQLSTLNSQLHLGRPYFVMELVQGVPITDFCDDNALSAQERLKLFMSVCEAVQHAHQKGIIHRDLKPSNILVTLHDGRPVPKVIDFGTAKALQRFLTEKTLFTGFGKLIGTPQYMSPEQAEMSGLDVDTRADIYSLGVLLYELLTGTTPFEAARLRSAAFEEMMRIIRQEEPPKPSTRVSTLGERGTEIAKQRQVDPVVLRRALQGDLDWIAMKALEKERGRRYETASALAADLQRHLNHEPVMASPQSAAYRARKFIRRNRPAVVIAGAVTLALVVGLSLALAGLQRALEAEDATRRERDRAVAAEAKAQDEAAIAEAVNEFLQQDLLRQASPMEQPDREVKLRALLDRASEKVGARFRGKPLIEADIRMTLSETYRNLGEYTNARVHLDRALQIYRQQLAPEDRRLLKARGSEAELLLEEGRPGESQAMLEQLLPVCERVLGPEHEDTIAARLTLVTSYLRQGELAKAQDLAEDLVLVSRRVRGAEHPLTLRALNRLAVAYMGLGKPGETERLLKETLPVMRKVLGPEHPGTLVAAGNLTAIDEHQVRLSASEKQYEELLKVLQRVVGMEHPNTLWIMGNLAAIYESQGQWAKAQTLREQLLQIRQRALGPEHRETLVATYEVFFTILQQDNFIEAQRLGEKLLPICRRVLGSEDPLTATLMHNLAYTYSGLGKPDESEALWREVLPVERRLYGPTDTNTCNVIRALGYHAGRKGDWPQALERFQELLTAQPENLNHWYRAHAAAMAAGQTNRCRELNEGMLARWGASQDPTTCECLAKSLLLASDRPADVDTGVALARRAYQAKPDWPWIQIAMAIAEYRLGHYPEAEALLERLQQDPFPIRDCLATYFVAMARHQQGDATAARRLLESANMAFATILRTGNLGDGWDDACRNLIARREAEGLILGREASPRVAAAYLAERRRVWEPVRQRLAEGSKLAEQQKWPEAGAAYAAALAESAFDWSAAEQADDVLSLKMSVSFRKAGDAAAARQLFGLLLSDSPASLGPLRSERHAKSCFLHWQELTPESRQAALRMSHSTLETQGAKPGPWCYYAAAMGEYRDGHWQRTVDLCQFAQQSDQIPCFGGALLYHAMGLKQMARNKEAAQVLQRAEGVLKESLRTRTGGSWFDLEMCQLALDEARPMMASDLAASQIKWETVSEALDRAFALAELQKWTEARDAYVQAWTSEAFDWRTAESTSSGSCLPLQMAVVFARAGDVASLERLQLFLSTLSPKPESVLAAERFAKVCSLTARTLPGDLQQRALEAARFASERQDQQRVAAWTCQSGGMAEFRAGDLERAVQLSLEAEKGNDAGCRGGAMLYRAMALKRLGRSAEALKVLQAAEEFLAAPLERRDGVAWWELGLCELALDEARLLLAAELEEMQARWEPVRKLLDDGFSHAKQRQWPEARAAYAKALAEPAFDWLTAERASFDGCLSLQMAVVFAEAGDRGNYERLCRLLVELPVDNSAVYAAERHAKSCFLQPADLPAEIQQRALAMARFAVTNRASVPWVCHSAGMAEFRAGQFARASELLLIAEKSDDIGCRGGAMAYRALTLMRMGRQAEGNQVLKAAEQLLAGALKRRMDPYWWDLDICQLALDEARQMMGQAAKP